MLAQTAVVTVLGMGVVFAFLVLLSAGMVGMRVLSSRSSAAEPGVTGVTPVSVAHADSAWLAAAVAAYLASDGYFEEVSAAPWDPLRGQR